jgi:hypothetical protein
MEFLENFRFELKEVNPCEFTEIIYKTDIIFSPPNRGESGTPHIRINKLQRMTGMIERFGVR